MEKEPRTQGHKDDGYFHAYATVIPNTIVRGRRSAKLSLHAKWLYVYLKSVTGHGGVCFRSTTTIAREAGMSRTQVSVAKNELVAQKLIRVVHGKNPRRHADHIRLVDLWPENMQEFSVPLANTDDESISLETSEDKLASVPLANTETVKEDDAMSTPPDQLSTHIDALMTETARQNRIWRGYWKHERGVPPSIADIPGYVPLRVAYPQMWEELIARQQPSETEEKNGMHPENCKHFNGINNDRCKMDIPYGSFGWKRGTSTVGLPCLTSDHREKRPCALFVLPTADELQENSHTQDEAMKQWLAEANAREQRGECWHCGKPVTAKRQVGRCIYAVPCGCRVGQGRLRDAQGKSVAYLDLTTPAGNLSDQGAQP